jgi:hypothetical protein
MQDGRVRQRSRPGRAGSRPPVLLSPEGGVCDRFGLSRHGHKLARA